jgi:hypothetical protein
MRTRQIVRLKQEQVARITLTRRYDVRAITARRDVIA